MGRPQVDAEIRKLIRRMSVANPLWGAPRIHGELLKLGLNVSEATVSKYMIRYRRPPSQSWRTFLANHTSDIAAIDFLTVPTYVLRDRDAISGRAFSRRMELVGLTEVVTAPRSPWQNPYVERVIGSIRRECLDHTIIVGERHLRRVVRNYVRYYNGVRTHLSLEKDAPAHRRTYLPEVGSVRSRPHCGGLHHEYLRAAA